jgi:hypothetical protein
VYNIIIILVIPIISIKGKSNRKTDTKEIAIRIEKLRKYNINKANILYLIY